MRFFGIKEGQEIIENGFKFLHLKETAVITEV